ncbi:MAG: hypothetical protein IJU45_01075, partial [Clostridia bacterium]|nr:hypothetical protein [Clostridia bacterium]
DSTKRKIDFALVFINDEDAISVTVKVNGAVEYTGTHYSSEGAITIPLTAYKGPNTVTVIQNNTVTYEELVDF